MAASSVPTRKARPRNAVLRASAAARAASPATIAPFAGLATISLVQAWEWLFSGLTKLQNDVFIRGFLGFVMHTKGPYGALMNSVAQTFGGFLPRLVEGTELTLGISLAASAVLVLVPRLRLRRLGIIVAGAASLVGVILATNIAILAGDRAPWKLGMAPFSTGVPVEALLAAVSIAAVVESYSAWRLTRTVPAVEGES
ncbi:MAG: hypothetical protein M3010_08095 [Candidatus Dormibacteraeota bacterium]|nr:hypothetical protein [Candidatus Dormibacteraeota bacterium]